MESMHTDIASLLSIKDVQATTKLSRSAVYELLTSGQLASVKVGRRRLVRSEDLTAWIKSLKASGAVVATGQGARHAA